MKKIFLMLMSVIICLSCLTSCGDSDSTDSGMEDDLLEQTNDYFDEREIEVKDINVFVGGEPNEWLKATAEVYQRKYGGKVTFTSVTWDMRITRLQQLIQSGDSPDVAVVYNYDAVTLMAQDILEPIDDYVDKSNENYNFDAMKSAYSKDGKMYGLVVKVKDTSPYMILYNKGIFQRMGVEYPINYYNRGEWTWDNFRKLAKEATDISGVTINNYGFGTWQDEIFCLANGVSPIVYNGSDSKVDLDSAPVREALQMLYDMINVDKSTVPNKFDCDDMFKNGKLAMVVGNTATMKSYMNSGMDIDFVPFPQGPSADKLYSFVQLQGFCIPKGAKSVQGGLAFAEINSNGFPALETKNKPEFTETQEEVYYEYCENPITTLADVNSPFSTVWMDFTNSIRNNTPVGTAVAQHKPVIEKAVSDLINNKSAASEE